MILGIDASNVRGGGGLTHLVELLTHASPSNVIFEKIILWGAAPVLSRMPTRDWLELVRVKQLEGTLGPRIYWQRVELPRLAKERCDILFVPGGSFSKSSVPVVTMSQNMLPFEAREFARYGLSWVLIRLLILRYVQSRSFREADGVIYLTEYASTKVAAVIGEAGGTRAIIPHGINRRFYSAPKQQLSIDEYSTRRPFKLLYVSIVDMYKHQWNVVEAVARLREEGLPVELDLVGPAYAPAYRKLAKVLDRQDPHSSFVRYRGCVPYEELDKYTKMADGVIFASTCENLPIILLEAMASGAPIICSDYGPMPEVLRDAGVYFDPECVESLHKVMQHFLDDRDLREKTAALAFRYAQQYSWERCARDTLEFLAVLGAKHGQKSA